MSGVFPWNYAVPGYPQTPDGQARFIRELVAWGRSEGVLSGIRPWAPDLRSNRDEAKHGAVLLMILPILPILLR